MRFVLQRVQTIYKTLKKIRRDFGREKRSLPTISLNYLMKAFCLQVENWTLQRHVEKETEVTRDFHKEFLEELDYRYAPILYLTFMFPL
jgi:hypothetical protein